VAHALRGTPTWNVGKLLQLPHGRGLAKAGPLFDVTGVGDAAFGSITGPLVAICFYKGDTMVVIMLMVGATAAPHKNEAITLAKTASSRI
jgi:hypothetical protein